MFPLRNLIYSITDHCNLKCENCGAFNPFKKSKNNVNVDLFDSDIKAISKRFEISNFKLIGGEPLLHPELKRLLIICRKYLPKIDIRLTSNGITFLNKDESFYNILSILKIKLIISNYDLNINHDKIKELCDSHFIDFHLSRSKTHFWDFVDKTGTANVPVIFKKCREDLFYPEYYNGRIYNCCYSKNSSFLNETNRVDNAAVDVGLDISSTDAELENYLYKPCPTCKFCTFNTITKPWRQLTKQEAENL